MCMCVRVCDGCAADGAFINTETNGSLEQGQSVTFGVQGGCVHSLLSSPHLCAVCCETHACVRVQAGQHGGVRGGRGVLPGWAVMMWWREGGL